MMCEHPIQLKNGLVVPCGKCLLCLSHRRDEWSIRMQLHALYTDSLSFFITFTYDDDHLTYGDDKPTLYKRDFQLFVKRLKDKYGLYNSDFAFVACGEYGDTFNRPHVHAILFGVPFLEDAYKRSWTEANEVIRNVWQNGFVYVGIAEPGGIHYTAKYILKFSSEDYSGVNKPFLLCSNGIGKPWLQSPEAILLKSRINYRKLKAIEQKFVIPVNLEWDSFVSYIKEKRSELAKYFPKFTCTLANDRKVPLPGYLKRKLVGSFELPTDNPFWIVHFCDSVIDMDNWSRNYRDYDSNSSMSYHDQVIDFARRKIYQRLLIKNQPLKNETV